MSKKNNSEIESYLESIKYEFEHDILYHNYFSSKAYIKLIPKPFSIQKTLSVFKNLINLIIPLVIPIWIILIHPFIVILFFFKYFLQSLRYKKEVKIESIYLDASDNKYFSNINTKDYNFPQFVLLFPFRKTYSPKIPKLKQIHFYSLTNIALFFKSAIYSFAVIWKLTFSSDRRMIFYSYTAFSWFLVFFTLRHSGIKTIWLSNHYDRWTVLVSKLPDIGITIVQHGQLYFNDHKNKVNLFPKFSKKIKNINRIYVINELSKSYFKLYIENKDLKFLLMKSNLKLISWRSTSGLVQKILIIGNHVQKSFQVEIVKELYNKFSNKIDICYKYHPRQTNKVNHKLIWEIYEKKIIPKADIVISYGSSIDYEIEQILNCEILYYDYLNKDSLSFLLSKIKKKLKN